MSNIAMAGGATGTGTVTLLAPSTSTNRTLTLPDETGTVMLNAAQSVPRTALPIGSVLQVVSATKTDTFSTASTSWTDVTGLSVSITPTSATSKIIVLATVNTSNTGAARFVIRLVRNSTAICVGDAAGSRAQTSSANEARATTGFMSPFSVNFLDSPSTTSSTTYKIQTNNIDGGTTVFNRVYNDLDSTSIARTASTITVMEIAA